MIAVILAGGLGTRLATVAQSVPKPMVEIAGKPILEHQINVFKRYGVKEIFMLTGHLSEVIEDHFADGEHYGVRIRYVREEKPLGTAGAIRQLKGILHEDFILAYGDILFDLKIDSFVDFHKSKGGIATLLVHPTDHMEDCDLLEIDHDSKLTKILSKPRPKGFYRNLNNGAFYLFSPKVFEFIKKDMKSDIAQDTLPSMLNQKELIYTYDSAEYVRDMGTPERLKAVTDDFISGRVRQMSKEFGQKAVFIEADLVVKLQNINCNYDKGLLFKNSASVIRQINESGRLCFLVFRFDCDHSVPIRDSLSDLWIAKIETALGKKSAFFDCICFLPDRDSDFSKYVFCGFQPMEKILAQYNISSGASWYIGSTLHTDPRNLPENMNYKEIQEICNLGDEDVQTCLR